MKNNYFNCFLFTNNRGCDLIKKKTGIIKPEGEIVKERLFITPEYTTAKEIKKIRKELHLTQKEFAEFINCSKPTVERWERSEDVIRGPIVPFLKMLQKYPEYEQEVKVPEKVWSLRIWYMYEQNVCTLIDVNELERKVKIRNYTDKVMFRAFGTVEDPDYNDYQEFLKSRCFPDSRDKINLILKDLRLPFYDPIMIIEKTEGRMAEDDFWIRIER